MGRSAKSRSDATVFDVLKRPRRGKLGDFFGMSDPTNFPYWLDLLIKAAIGVVISLVGIDYRSVKNSLVELERAKYTLSTDVQIIQSNLNHLRDSMQNIDKKLDKALDK
jgi:hypothetical protein